MIDRKELVKKMIQAFLKGAGWNLAPQEYSFGMDAALSVAVDELLQEPNDVERKVFYVAYEESNRLTIAEDREAGLEAVIANRRVQFEKVKTPHEQIEAVIDKHRAQINNGRTPINDMVIELTGLIAQLKGSA